MSDGRPFNPTIPKALDFVGWAAEKTTEAQEMLHDEDLDAEGPLANAIQYLTIALKIVRDLKKEKQSG